MKKSCGYHPAIGKAPKDLRWNVGRLLALSTPGKQGYFLPLGRLGAGRILLHGIVDSFEPIRIEFISDTFEFVAEQSVYPSEGHFDLMFENTDSKKLFLRVTGSPAPILREVVLESVE